MSVTSTGLSHHETSATTPLSRLTYDISEAAKLLGISRNACFQAARVDALPVPVIRVGRRMLVSKAALDRILIGESTSN